MGIRLIALLVIFATTAFPCSMLYQKSVYSKRPDSSSALFRFERNGKSGFIDASGNVVIPPTFKPDWFAQEDFVEGLSPVLAEQRKWGFINESGEWVVQPQYGSVNPFSEGLAAVADYDIRNDFPKAYIDRNGIKVIELPRTVGDAGRFSEGLASVTEKGYRSSGKVGFIDRSGEVVIEFQFAVGGDFHEGLSRVVLDGQCYVTASDGSRQPPPSVPAASSCGGVPTHITTACREGYIDRTGNLRFEFERTQDFSEGLAGVVVEGKWGYINPQGLIAIPPRFDEVLPFSEGLAAARIGSNWGYIDHDGMDAIPPRFRRASSFSNGVAKVEGGYIDKQGSLVIKGWDSGTDFVHGLAHVNLGGQEFGYISQSGEVVFRYSGADYGKSVRDPWSLR